MKVINLFAAILVVFGAINYGLWGLFQFDFIAYAIYGNTSWWARFCYTLIGVSGLWHIWYLLWREKN
ncbi:MAG: DUF378 domain-containing protein [Simkaniaceae bacterium]|nr:DUF378 domain-containing protein [Simkaniaceae bacterium]